MSEYLEDYMYRHDLDEEKVLMILKGAVGNYIDDNEFYFEIVGDTAYIETKNKQKLVITECNTDKGYIELKAIKVKENE